MSKKHLAQASVQLELGTCRRRVIFSRGMGAGRGPGMGVGGVVGSGHCPNRSDEAEDALGKGKGLAKVPQPMRGESEFDSSRG